MPDIVGRDVRSRMMAGIRGKHTQPEIRVRRFLHARGFRYLLHRRDLPGTPDLVLPKYGAVVFVHGCFWHAHQKCKYAKLPATRADFWRAKLEGNRARDRRDAQKLFDAGWRVAVIWECALREEAESSLAALSGFLKSGDVYAEFSLVQEPRIE